MSTTPQSSAKDLPLAETTESACCACCSTDQASVSAAEGEAVDAEGLVTKTYGVAGMTCGHCSQSVTSELMALEGVAEVRVALDPGGTSRVTVVSTEPLDDRAVGAAVDEAGDYSLV